jgi:hypothetical protein
MIPETYNVETISCAAAKKYIIENHYSHGCHNGPKPCFGLYDDVNLIGVMMFATPCSEAVRSSIFGVEYKNHVTELHRLHILDCTPKNTETWFIARCLKYLKNINPEIWAVLSFSDMTEGHSGVIYKAANAYRLGTTGKATFFLDETGRLRHPRQCGINITKEMAEEKKWASVKREAKNRYMWLLPNDKRHKKELIKLCKYDLKGNIC